MNRLNRTERDSESTNNLQRKENGINWLCLAIGLLGLCGEPKLKVRVTKERILAPYGETPSPAGTKLICFKNRRHVFRKYIYEQGLGKMKIGWFVWKLLKNCFLFFFLKIENNMFSILKNKNTIFLNCIF